MCKIEVIYTKSLNYPIRITRDEKVYKWSNWSYKNPRVKDYYSGLGISAKVIKYIYTGPHRANYAGGEGKPFYAVYIYEKPSRTKSLNI